MHIKINGLVGDLFAIDGLLKKQYKESVSFFKYTGRLPIQVAESLLKIMFPNARLGGSGKIDLRVSSFKNMYQFQHSSFLTKTLADITQFNLKNFVFVHPKSKGKNLGGLKIRFIEPLVFVGTQQVECSGLNLIGKTTLFEAIELLKSAKHFVGINSSFAVLAAKHFDYQNLHIKICSNTNCKFYYNLKHNYFNETLRPKFI
jgi:hypothetical protein